MSGWPTSVCFKVGGRNIWCWDVIDSDSRFLLSTHLSPARTTRDAKELMDKALAVAGKPPKVIITDSLKAYIDGIELTFGVDTKHVQSHPFTDADLSTNKIERWHSTLKARTEIMRGLKSLRTAQALLDGWLVHYNFFRPHESLDDKTPAETAGIRFPYRNWLDVIEAQKLVVQEGSKADAPPESAPEYPIVVRRRARRARGRNRRTSGRRAVDTTIRGVR